MKLGGYRGSEVLGGVEAGDDQSTLYKMFLHDKKYSYHSVLRQITLPYLNKQNQ